MAASDGSESVDSENDDESYNESIEAVFADGLQNMDSQKFRKFNGETPY